MPQIVAMFLLRVVELKKYEDLGFQWSGQTYENRAHFY